MKTVLSKFAAFLCALLLILFAMPSFSSVRAADRSVKDGGTTSGPGIITIKVSLTGCEDCHKVDVVVTLPKGTLIVGAGPHGQVNYNEGIGHGEKCHAHGSSDDNYDYITLDIHDKEVLKGNAIATVSVAITSDSPSFSFSIGKFEIDPAFKPTNTPTPVPATATPIPATATPVPATATPVPATATPKPTAAPTKAAPTAAPTKAAPTKAAPTSTPKPAAKATSTPVPTQKMIPTEAAKPTQSMIPTEAAKPTQSMIPTEAPKPTQVPVTEGKKDSITETASSEETATAFDQAAPSDTTQTEATETSESDDKATPTPKDKVTATPKATPKADEDTEETVEETVASETTGELTNLVSATNEKPDSGEDEGEGEDATPTPTRAVRKYANTVKKGPKAPTAGEVIKTIIIIIAVVIVCRIIYLKYNDVYNEDLLKEFIPEKLRPKKAKKVETETPEAVNGFLKISNTRSIRPEFSNAAAEVDRHRGVNRKNENGNSDPSNK